VKIAGNTNVATYVKNKALTESGQPPGAAASRKNVLPDKGATKVSLSRKSKEIFRAREIISTLPETRRDVVENIKESIRDGAYNINTDQIAHKMMEQH